VHEQQSCTPGDKEKKGPHFLKVVQDKSLIKGSDELTIP